MATNDPKHILRKCLSPKGHSLVRKADKIEVKLSNTKKLSTRTCYNVNLRIF